MPQTVTILRIFVASPSDVAEERAALEEVITELNHVFAPTLGLRLDLVKWETHAFPAVGTDPQSVINDQIGDDYDIFIGLMWTKFGTPTPRAGSGTAEEFERAYRRYQENPDSVRIMFYFKIAPVSPDFIDPQQIALVRDFRAKLGDEGVLYFKYETRDQFTSQLRVHLQRQLQSWNHSWGTGLQSDATTQRIASVPVISQDTCTEADESEGLIDLIERANSAGETLKESAERLGEAIADMGRRMQSRTAELNAATVPGRRFDLRLTRRVLDATATDIDNWSERARPEIDIISRNYRDLIDAYSRTISLQEEFGGHQRESVVEQLAQMESLTGSIGSAVDSMIELRGTMAGIPPISTNFNRARNGATRVLDQLNSELDTAKSITSGLVSSLRQLLAELESKVEPN